MKLEKFLFESPLLYGVHSVFLPFGSRVFGGGLGNSGVYIDVMHNENENYVERSFLVVSVGEKIGGNYSLSSLAYIDKFEKIDSFGSHKKFIFEVVEYDVSGLREISEGEGEQTAL